jgi:hypothetical protein
MAPAAAPAFQPLPNNSMASIYFPSSARIPAMIIGHNHHLLERRISAALLSGNARPKEAIFLHNMSAKILARGKNATVTDTQARWLFALLARLEPTRPSLPTPPRAAERPGCPHSGGFACPESHETPSSLQSIQHGPFEPTRNPTPPPHVVTSCPTPASTCQLVKLKAPRQTPPTRPKDGEIPIDWAIRCFARIEARRLRREIWLASKKYRRLYNQPIGPKDISSD